MNAAENKKAEAVFNFIVQFKRDHDGNSPSIREIQQGCRISSTSMVEFYLDCLVDDGRISMADHFKSRMISVTGGEWNLNVERAVIHEQANHSR